MENDRQYLAREEYETLAGITDMPLDVYIRLEYRARKEIDKHTFGRLIELPEQTNDVKMCMVELINLFHNEETKQAENSATSESIDGYSVTYQNRVAKVQKELTQNVSAIIRAYLLNSKLEDGTPYMYCGV